MDIEIMRAIKDIPVIQQTKCHGVTSINQVSLFLWTKVLSTFQKNPTMKHTNNHYLEIVFIQYDERNCWVSYERR